MKIFLSEHIDSKALHLLRENFEIVDNFEHPEEIVGAIVRTLPLDQETLQPLVNLKIISKHGVGIDNIDQTYASSKGIVIKNVPGASTTSVAELAVGYLLALTRRIKEIDHGLRAGRYHKAAPYEVLGIEVSAKKIGFVGSGNIAQKMASILKNGFNCQIYCYNPSKDEGQCAQLGFEKIDTLEQLFATMDFVSINVPLNDATANMIDATLLNKANPELILVNTSRGGIVDETALYQALTTGKIKAAACDVFAQEPCAPDNNLLNLENFIATPHIGINTNESLERVGLQSVTNIINFLK